MSVRSVFRCQFCSEPPDPETQAELERQQQHAFYGRYVDAGPGRWLVWHGHGLLGPKRYACGAHRGELTAYLRFHYATVGGQVWKMGPYPRPPPAAGNASSSQVSRMGGSGFAI